MRHRKKWQCAAVCLAALALVATALPRGGRAAQVAAYTVTDLGTLGGAQSRAYALNNCGRVVGESQVASGASHAFSWAGGQMTDLSPQGWSSTKAHAVNAAGMAAGGAETTGSVRRAFVWTEAAGLTDIGTLGGSGALANDINDAGRVVGDSEVPASAGVLTNRAFVWDAAGGMVQLATLGGASNSATGINNADQIAGTSATSGGETHAYFLSGGVLTDLGTLGTGRSSFARGLNDGGEVVGFSYISTTTVDVNVPQHAFIWSATTGMLDMGTLPGGRHSYAYAINNAGKAVGTSQTQTANGPRHAFVYTRTGGMVDLNDLTQGSGWTLSEAYAVNDRGEIVGFGLNPEGQTRAFLLTPVTPEGDLPPCPTPTPTPTPTPSPTPTPEPTPTPTPIPTPTPTPTPVPTPTPTPTPVPTPTPTPIPTPTPTPTPSPTPTPIPTPMPTPVPTPMPTPAGPLNVALAANGGTVTASSTYDSRFTPTSLNNGDRRGLNWGAGGGWSDATANTYPDWVEVTFSGAKTISEVSVFTVQDAFSSPAEPTAAMTFTKYGARSLRVEQWTGAAWELIPGAQVVNTGLVWNRFTFAPVTTTKIRVVVNQALDGYSRLVEVEAWEGSAAPTPTPTPTPAPTPTPSGPLNVALAANGGTVTASSTYDSRFTPTSLNNGDRKGLNWGAGGGWSDATANTYPDWVEVSFNGTRTINQVDVFTVQDAFSSPAEPTAAMTFTKYGARSLRVEQWTGSAWEPVPGAQVVNTGLVWNRFTFAPVTTTKIRVVVNQALDGYSRLVEVEAWEGSAAPTPTPTPSPTPTPAGPLNVALAANGGAVTTSSSYDSRFPAASLNNGDRRGLNWGAGGGWSDATLSSYPDWVEVSFSGAKTISEVSVFTIQDAFASPAEPTAAMTFTKYGVTAFQVQYWTGTAWAPVPGGSVAGNNQVWRKLTFAPITTTGVRVVVTGALDGYSRLAEVEVWQADATVPGRVNHALAANGGAAAGSSTYDSRFPAAGVNDGDRRGLNWAAGGGWSDATANSFPDWVEVSFGGAKSVSEVNVFTVQDAFSSPSEPTETMVFTQYGVTAFDVQAWDGTQWVTVPGGAVTGNNLVWRKVTFAPVTTTKVRVLVKSALNGHSRLVEIEAY